MKPPNLKTPKKGAGSLLRELSKKRREGLKPSKDLIDLLKAPAVSPGLKKSAKSDPEVGA